LTIAIYDIKNHNHSVVGYRILDKKRWIPDQQAI